MTFKVLRDSFDNQALLYEWCDQHLISYRARTALIHFDLRIFNSPKWIKNHKKILIREVNQYHFSFLIHVGESLYFWFWFILIHLRSKRIAMIPSDSVWFWFVANHDSPANHLRIYESSTNQLRINYESTTNQNQSESRIKLVRALICWWWPDAGNEKSWLSNPVFSGDNIFIFFMSLLFNVISVRWTLQLVEQAIEVIMNQILTKCPNIFVSEKSACIA